LGRERREGRVGEGREGRKEPILSLATALNGETGEGGKREWNRNGGKEGLCPSCQNPLNMPWHFVTL